ncbi:MAG: cbb3-type cytochrome oxidase assembly protein CcoS [Sinobacterium sp.]|nr:cbb3-type cytochrome oxidase assembly protein CcoS [Sinobacterium sp.]
MQSLYFLIPLALLATFVAGRIFLWAVDNKQFDDLDRESRRILEDD